MVSQETCYGVAFRSLATTDEQLFQNTVQFYHNLGFSTIKDFNKFHNGDNSILSTGTSKDSIKETWLEAFKLSEIDAQGFRVPQQEASFKQEPKSRCSFEGAFNHVSTTITNGTTINHLFHH